jgi:hypothetical protein
MRECLFYSHDEINNKYQLYVYEKGCWVDIDWLVDAYQVINPYRNIAIKMTSTEVEKYIEKYQKRSIKRNIQEDKINLIYMGYHDKEDVEDQFFLVLGSTLWRINEETKLYQIYDVKNDSWCNMVWLEDKLEHEVECSKHNGQRLSYEEAIKTKNYLRDNYLKRINTN